MNVLPKVEGAVDTVMFITCPKCRKVRTYVVKCDIAASTHHLTATATCVECRRID